MYQCNNAVGLGRLGMHGSERGMQFHSFGQWTHLTGQRMSTLCMWNNRAMAILDEQEWTLEDESMTVYVISRRKLQKSVEI